MLLLGVVWAIDAELHFHSVQFGRSTHTLVGSGVIRLHRSIGSSSAIAGQLDRGLCAALPLMSLRRNSHVSPAVCPVISSRPHDTAAPTHYVSQTPATSILRTTNFARCGNANLRFGQHRQLTRSAVYDGSKQNFPPDKIHFSPTERDFFNQNFGCFSRCEGKRFFFMAFSFCTDEISLYTPHNFDNSLLQTKPNAKVNTLKIWYSIRFI